jgi:hypoxanthine phosphoribosyltransferase
MPLTGQAELVTPATMSLPAWRQSIEVLYDPPTLQARVAELGAQISADFAGRSLCVVGVLKGCFVFLADLTRHIDLPVRIDFIGISSYGNATQSSGIVQITQDLQQSIEGKDVLLVEDIVDSGLSMAYLLENFATRRPRSVRVCTLLEKPENAKIKVDLDYVGFQIPNRFVIGYGLDAAGYCRNLPFIGTFGPDVDLEAMQRSFEAS